MKDEEILNKIDITHGFKFPKEVKALIEEALKIQRDDFREKLKSLINKYLKEEKKTTNKVEKEWKEEKNYPMYSNQYYAFTELKHFWKELADELNNEKKEELSHSPQTKPIGFVETEREASQSLTDISENIVKDKTADTKKQEENDKDKN